MPRWYHHISYMEVMCKFCNRLVYPNHDTVKMQYTCPFCSHVILSYKEGEHNGQSIGGAR